MHTNPENPRVTLQTNEGDITIELYEDLTPETAGNFLKLAKDGYFDGTRFHRVIDGFMIQGGDPLTKDPGKKKRWGTGGPGYTIKDEFATKDGDVSTRYPTPPAHLKVKHTSAGILSMANTGRPNSGGSQFFITLDSTPHLDGKHPVFGCIDDGMDVVKRIGKCDTDRQDRPKSDVVIKGVTVQE